MSEVLDFHFHKRFNSRLRLGLPITFHGLTVGPLTINLNILKAG